MYADEYIAGSSAMEHGPPWRNVGYADTGYFTKKYQPLDAKVREGSDRPLRGLPDPSDKRPSWRPPLDGGRDLNSTSKLVMDWSGTQWRSVPRR